MFVSILNLNDCSFLHSRWLCYACLSIKSIFRTCTGAVCPGTVESSLQKVQPLEHQGVFCTALCEPWMYQSTWQGCKWGSSWSQNGHFATPIPNIKPARLSSPYLLKRRSVIADTVLSITFNILISTKLQKSCTGMAGTCCVSRVSSKSLFTRARAGGWTEGGAVLCLWLPEWCLKPGSWDNNFYFSTVWHMHSLPCHCKSFRVVLREVESFLLWFVCKIYIGKNW